MSDLEKFEAERESEDNFLDALSNGEVHDSSPKEEEPISKVEQRRRELQAEIQVQKVEEKDSEDEVVEEKIEEKPSEKEPTGSMFDELVTKEIKPEEEPPKKKKVEKVVEQKVEEKPKKKTKTEKKVEVLTPEQVEVIKKEEIVDKNIGKEVPTDDFEKKIQETQLEIYQENMGKYSKDTDEDELDDIADLSSEEITKTVSDFYEEEQDEEKENIVVEVTDEEKEKEKAKKKQKENTKKEPSTEKRKMWYGGDGETTSFKSRTAKNSKILRNINIEDTTTVRPVDIANKSQSERNNFYLKTILPTIQSNYCVIPMILSGVVISMSAFGWNDVRDIRLIEEKMDDLDVESEDYIYNKNMLFIEKRRKQCDLFYKHIIAVSGFDTVPEKERLFRDILKFPDFSQLFFGAYCSTFPKKVTVPVTCGTCGYENDVSVNPKDLCFLLNKNISIDRLNHYISKGGSLNNNETADVYREFQSEALVQNCNKVFRTKKTLPNSAFIYEMKIPSIYEALDAMTEVADVFRKESFDYINPESGDVVYIDSPFGLTPELVTLRKYLYIKSLLAAQTVSGIKEDENIVKVNYVKVEDLNSIMGSIYQLSSEDYYELMNDPLLNNLIICRGIEHAVKAGKCGSEICNNDMGIIPIDPETLFFIIARRSIVN